MKETNKGGRMEGMKGGRKASDKEEVINMEKRNRGTNNMGVNMLLSRILIKSFKMKK